MSALRSSNGVSTLVSDGVSKTHLKGVRKIAAYKSCIVSLT